jgi:hypothetical protein
MRWRIGMAVFFAIGHRVGCVGWVWGASPCVWAVCLLSPGCVWAVCGLCVGCVWAVCGLCVGCVWAVCGLFLGCV